MIRKAGISDLKAIAEMGREFYAEGRIPGTVVPRVFVRNWTRLLNAEIGVIYVAMEHEKLIGTIGGIIHPDTNDDVKVLSEMFWFVSKGYRGRYGLKLLDAFEKWGSEREAERFMMVHLETLTPEKLKKLYERLGYEKVETHYLKKEE